MNLKEQSKELSLVLSIIQHLFGIESAIFDADAELVLSSSKYQEKKGTVVHTPSITEVLEKDETVILEPGHMASCYGCRFNGHCPATLEILKRILVDGEPVGVLSFSAFSEELRDRISSDIDFFKSIIVDFSNIISALLKGSHDSSESYEPLLTAFSAFSGDGYLTADPNGRVTHINDTALNLLAGSCLGSIRDFAPEELVQKILDGDRLNHYPINLTPEYTLEVSSAPLGSPGEGALLLLSQTPSRLSPRARLFPGSSMYGSGRHMQEIRRKMSKLVNSPSPLFISGETGTGKSLLARSIHAQSSRSRGPFITVNCANLTDSLFETELFGYEAGAFSGALHGGKRGKLELAEGGTLFLDEISEIPYNAQAKLLYVLQNYQFERVGGISSKPLNARIISASNVDLEARIREGRFRADLYYRLNVINVDMVPLRDRKEDIPELADAFISRFNTRLGTEIEGFTPEALEILSNYDWPGNVRQLENAVEYGMNMAESRRIGVSDLPAYLIKENRPAESPDGKSLRKAEREVIAELLDRYGWDKNGKEKAAASLGISVRTLYRKLGE